MAEEPQKKSAPATGPLKSDSYTAFTHSRTRGLDPADVEEQAPEPQPEPEPPPPPPEPVIPVDVEEELANALQTLKRNTLIFFEIVGKLIARVIDVLTWPLRIMLDALIGLLEMIWFGIWLAIKSVGGALLLPFRPFIRYIQIVRDPMGVHHFSDEDHDDDMEDVAAEPEAVAPPVAPRIHFIELAEKGIVFVDDKRSPLYTLDRLRGKKGYTVEHEIMDAAIIEQVLTQFKVLAPRARSLPAPQSGRFAGVAMSDVLETASEQDVRDFVYYVNTFPKKYIGKELKFAGSFAAWVTAGAPLE